VHAGSPAPGPIERARTRELEVWSWYFFRISGLMLAILALGHLAIMHLVYTVDVIDYDWVASRWARLGWRVYDWLLLVLALLHGMNGARVVVDDYVYAPRWRRVALSALAGLTVVFLIVGTLTVVLFQPAP
jgi:succinate dehydrogenase / fumarate reductase, membrane anchor subunit